MKRQATIIIQARTGSTRLPRKVLADLGGRPIISFMIERLRRCQTISKIILATTDTNEDNFLAELGHTLNLTVVRGSTRDVLGRFALAADKTSDQILVRITGDCPFVEPALVDTMVKKYNDQKNIDYLNNCSPPSFPDGLDIEVFSKESLIRAQKECGNTEMREHVTQWIRESGKYKCKNYQHSSDLSHYRWTVDEPEDLTVIRNVVNHFKDSSDFTWDQVIELSETKPELFIPNQSLKRNEGMRMKEGQKLWKRAKRVIPGGNMLLSKRAEMFLPEQWPTYYSKASGCFVWDLAGNKYTDMSIMGIGTNILGYSNEEIDSAVIENIRSGNMSTLNCPEEVWLAEKLIELHPWAHMARFARSGGEANAISIRIARAATGRETIAICGYHGWHDWYLATNLKNESGLEEHLLPGLEPCGVPEGLAGSVIPFSYNRLDQLIEINKNNSLAAVKMEVQRSNPPEPGFLEGVRKLCNENGIVLIFDECTSGFRETFGGLHLKYNIQPDMAMFGKALGNGFAITATIGTKAVMEAAQKTFISSTFWTERAGPTAALKTLEIMEREQSWKTITENGLKIKQLWQKLADEHGLDIKINGLDALASFQFTGKNQLAYKTILTQEMLKKGYLASTSLYSSISHTSEITGKYFDSLDNVFTIIEKCEKTDDIHSYLEGPVCHDGFKRLN